VEGYSVKVVLWYTLFFAIVFGSPVKKVEALGFGFLGFVVLVIGIDILELPKPFIQNPSSETFILGAYVNTYGFELRDNNRQIHDLVAGLVE